MTLIWRRKRIALRMFWKLVLTMGTDTYARVTLKFQNQLSRTFRLTLVWWIIMYACTIHNDKQKQKLVLELFLDNWEFPTLNMSASISLHPGYCFKTPTYGHISLLTLLVLRPYCNQVCFPPQYSMSAKAKKDFEPTENRTQVSSEWLCFVAANVTTRLRRRPFWNISQHF